MNPERPAPPGGETRRTFLKQTAAGAVLLAGAELAALGAARAAAGPERAEGGLPWYRRARRWGQTNITERDPARYDVAWWRQYWRRTAVQGVVVNAGGIVAYYPTQVPFHHRAEFLGDRDLFGELCAAAHADGLAVFARMDSSSAHEDCFQAHPDWFMRDANGAPYRNRDLYVACVNSPYYDEHLPAILREIAARYRPDGFTDNSWSGPGRNSPCFCDHCRRQFRARTGQELPRGRDWNDPVYRAWIEWNYARRLEIWDANNRLTRAAGGPDCLWVGMNGGSVTGEAHLFRDLREIARRAELLMLDDQRRTNETGFQRNGEVGKLVHGVLGWDKLMPESMAMYQTTAPTFRLSAKPEPEARMWMLEGFAGGIQPWWHHVGAYQEDRRMFRTAGPILRWHRANEEILFDRRPVATVGVLWSQRNTDFFGRDDAELLVDLPARGFMQALVRARIPYLPVHADDLERDAAPFRALVLPNLAALTGDQAGAVRRFVARGGGLLATGWSSLADAGGDPRPDFALADVLGVHLPADHGARKEATRRRWAAETAHSYLRLTPALGARVDGPHVPGETPAVGERHPVLRGFDDTDILPFGGTLEPLTVDAKAQVLLTFVPSFPAFPPEESWMRTPQTDIPGLVLNERAGAGRVAYLAADLDRRYARDNLPDHGHLLANLVRWVARDDLPLTVEGPGLIDCHLYRQPGRMILHVVNLTSAATWRAPAEELLPVGPLRVAVRLADDVRAPGLRLLVSGRNAPAAVRDGWCRFELPALTDHEVIVIG
jgi:Hypothetical glycosyl hydrolase 6